MKQRDTLPTNGGSGPEDVHRRVKSQFGAAAADYTKSAGHGDPQVLGRLVELIRPRGDERLLDIATGAGHTALAFAPHVAEVVAFDLTPQMLEETARNALARGLGNVRTHQGTAEALPFADTSFDIVTVRQAPHHYADVERAVREMARVVKRRGRVLMVDTTVPEDDTLALEINRIEKLRDPSHVQDYRPSRWRAMVEAAGLRVSDTMVDLYMENGKPMSFATWTERMRTPAAAVAELIRLFRGASPALTVALKVEFDGDQIFFCLPQLTMVAVRD
jgi:ubiquinone/menaquinone biosynthesis C-methylase UbiE